MAKHSSRSCVERRSRRLGLEQLETRAMLSATVVAQFGVNERPDIEMPAIADGELASDAARIAAAKTAQEVASDYYWTDGRKVPLQRSATELAIAYKSGVARQELLADLATDDGPLSKFDWLCDVAADVAVFRVKDGQTNPKAIVESAAAALASRVEIAWSAPAYTAPESGVDVVIPNEIIVALKPGTEPSKYFGSQFVGYRPLRGTPDQFVVTLAGGGEAALRAANDLMESGDVAWATPNFYQQFQKATNDPLYSSQWHLILLSKAA